MNKNLMFTDNNKQHKYTKITVPIMLLKSPSDYEDLHYFLDVDCNDYSQDNCYIGTQKIKNINFIRV